MRSAGLTDRSALKCEGGKGEQADSCLCGRSNSVNGDAIYFLGSGGGEAGGDQLLSCAHVEFGESLTDIRRSNKNYNPAACGTKTTFTER